MLTKLTQGHIPEHVTRAAAHAYLFFGAPYVTTEYRAAHFIRSLTCSNSNCQICTSDGNFDLTQHRFIHEVAPSELKSNIPIEAIRSFVSSVKLPSEDRLQIGFIRHAHRLQKNAANALLKVLEEPPAGVKFVLVAESIQYIPATVISRCVLVRTEQSEIASNFKSLPKNFYAQPLHTQLDFVQKKSSELKTAADKSEVNTFWNSFANESERVWRKQLSSASPSVVRQATVALESLSDLRYTIHMNGNIPLYMENYLVKISAL